MKAAGEAPPRREVVCSATATAAMSAAARNIKSLPVNWKVCLLL